MTDTKMPDFTPALRTMLTEAIGPDGIDAGDLYGKLIHEDLLWPIVVEAATAAHSAGLVKPYTNAAHHGYWNRGRWDRFAADGMGAIKDYEVKATLGELHNLLTMTYHQWMRDPEGKARAAHPMLETMVAALLESVKPIKTVTSQHIDIIASDLNEMMQNPRTRRAERGRERPSQIDGSWIYVMFDGWEPHVATWAHDTGLVPLPPVTPQPPVRHYEIETQGRLVMFPPADTEEVLQEAFHEVFRDKMGTNFGANIGVNQCLLDVYEATGILNIRFGDNFPCLYREGEVLRGMAHFDEDPPHGIDCVEPHSIDDPAMGAWEELAAFVGGDDKLEALVAEGYVKVFDVPAGPLHIYAPDGWRTNKFSKVFQTGEVPGLQVIPNEYTYFVISPTEIDFPDGMTTKVEMPERPAAEASAGIAP